MTSTMTGNTVRRVYPEQPTNTSGAAAAPRRFGDELEGPFSANLMRDQFDRLFRQFGR
jgi:hypothetical protein